MFTKILYFIALISLAIGSPQVYSIPSCEDGFSISSIIRAIGLKYAHTNSKTTGIESYNQLLIRLAHSSLGIKKLSPQQREALKNYHSVVRGELGTDGTLTRVGNYTIGQRRKIIRYLESNGFSREQVRTLIEYGVVEINRSKSTTNRRVLKSIREGKKLFVHAQYGKVSRIKKVLEETDNGFLVEIESIDVKSGQRQPTKEKLFLTKEDIGVSTIIAIHIDAITEILDKTNRGFVLNTKYGNKFFLPFEEAIKNGLLPKKPTSKDYHELEDTLNNYISGSIDKIPALKSAVYRRGNDVIISNNRTYNQFIHSLEMSLMRGLPIVLFNPEMEAVFLASRSTRKKVSSRDLNFSPPSNRETQLAKQGYGSFYIGGLDKINEWVTLRRKLQELRANPHTTHIEYFANQIPDHIAHIKTGIENNYHPSETYYGSKSDQLRELETLEQEAKKAISDKKVTYQWWLEFNNQLARVMSGLKVFSMNSRSRIITDIEYFPLKIIIPTIEDPLGIITFNRASAEGIYPASLINQQFRTADNNEMRAEGFFGHDIGHSNSGGNSIYLEYSFGHRLFHKRLLDNIENLPQEKRKKAEIIYFLMTHEKSGQNISYSDQTPQQMKENINSSIRGNIDGFLKLPDDPAQKEQKIEDLANTFMEVYNRALQHQ